MEEGDGIERDTGAPEDTRCEATGSQAIFTVLGVLVVSGQKRTAIADGKEGHLTPSLEQVHDS